MRKLLPIAMIIAFAASLSACAWMHHDSDMSGGASSSSSSSSSM